MNGRTSASPAVGLAFMGALALTGTLLATGSPAAAAAPHACRVTDLDTRRVTGSLQRAVRAASAGDRLLVRGTCRGVARIGRICTSAACGARPLAGPSWMAPARVPC